MAAEKKVGAIFHPSATINGKTFRGDYGDSNQMFKSICSTIGKNKPEVCKNLNFKNGKSQDERDNIDKEFDIENKDDMKEARKQFNEYESTLVGMEKRAQGAEVILGLVIVFIINCMCVSFCKIHNKKKRSDA